MAKIEPSPHHLLLTRMCDDEARPYALSPETAASDLLWLVEQAADRSSAPASGRFWRHRAMISMSAA